MRILIIEHNASQAQAVELILNRGGAVVEIADTAEDGIELVKHYDFDLVVLNMGMPDMRGVDLLRNFRRNKVTVPVLAMQSNSTVADRVAALNAGADDYLPRPFAAEELSARVTSLVRRSRGFASSDISLGNLVLNLDAKSVSVGGRDVHLTGKEYQVLELLAMRRGTAVTKEMMLNNLYGGVDEPEAKIIDVFVCKLRKKLRAIEGATIETVWGRGYLLSEKTAAPVAAAPKALVA
jgi:two-component system cell cycle response regulator CtrA